MLKTAWKLIRLFIILFGVLLSFIALMEFLQAYQALRMMHPIAGYLFLLAVAAGLIWAGMYYWKTVASRPRVLTPPTIEDFSSADIRCLRKYIRYLSRYLERLSGNPNLSEDQRREAKRVSDSLREVLSNSRSRDELLCLIGQTEESVIRPLLKEIDEKANKHVRDSMRDVMVFVTLSPYKSIDLAVVIYRNIRMVLDVVKMYNSRPALREQAAIFYDIFTIVATVNYIHLGRNLIESLGSKIPGIGRFLDDIAQGIGAGFLTTVTGHAAMQRCRAFTGWNPQKARESMLSRLTDFYADVRDVFFKDVWGLLVHKSDRAFAAAKDTVAGALDEAGRQIAEWIRTPVDLAVGAGKSLGDWITKPFRKE
ncbi:MAG: YcjF family protein [Anaerohalosphaeraceae bacterium]